MIQIAELLEPTPTPLWRLVKQAGVTEIVSLLDGGEQRSRWLKSGSQDFEPRQLEVAPRGERPWELQALEHMKDAYADYELDLTVIEDTPPLDDVRLGGARRDEQIDWLLDQIRAMGRLGIRTLCYNWLARASWSRTDSDIRLRGGAITNGFDEAKMAEAPPLIEPGSVTPADLWRNFAYFLEAVVPVAEEAGVRLALHPDDPPLAEVRGVPRIMGSPEAFDRVVSTVDSEANGITLCQGNFRLMTDDLPSVIRRFGVQKKIFFVHFRDVAGDAHHFVEVFHDAGPTDMLECMRAYQEVGFDGPMRPDHVPAFEGESGRDFGYATLGRLHAIGYIAGLREATYGKPPGTPVEF
jgi:mannonate dehydratase